jgi:hypothetical protein
MGSWTLWLKDLPSKRPEPFYSVILLKAGMLQYHLKVQLESGGKQQPKALDLDATGRIDQPRTTGWEPGDLHLARHTIAALP